MTQAINYLGAAELAAKIRRRDLSSRAVVGAFLTHIGTHIRKYNAIVTLDDKQAPAQAVVISPVLASMRGTPLPDETTNSFSPATWAWRIERFRRCANARYLMQKLVCL